MDSDVGYIWNLISMLHQQYAQEFPDKCKVNNMSKITHPLDGKDVTIETVRENDNILRRTRSEKSMKVLANSQT